MQEQHRLGAFPEHRQEGDAGDGQRSAGAERLAGVPLQTFEPGAAVLLQEQPAAHVEHQQRGDEHHHGFEPVVMGAVHEELEQSRGDEAGEQSRAGAEVERADRPRRLRLVQEGGEGRDDEQGLDALPQQDGGGLQGGRQERHARSPDFTCRRG